MTEAIRITSPVDGDVLNHHDGTSGPNRLEIVVRGEAAEGRPVTVTCRTDEAVAGGGPAESTVTAVREGGRFAAPVWLQGRHSSVVASDGVSEARLQLLWDYASVPRYRFSVDDNILFLKDIARGSYRSLFDHWYLAFWRGLHQQFGTKVHINIYYQTDSTVFSGEPFRLPQMPDRYRGEWQDNADWLHLTFHGWQNAPDRPYRFATYEQMAHDYDAVTAEIARFASEATIGKFTTVHWAECPQEAVRALRDRGVIGLMGDFRPHNGQRPTTCYYIDDALADHIGTRDYWWDSEVDMRFVPSDATVNWYNKEQIVPHLETVAPDPHRAELLELIVHEEYFRKELHWYKPDMQETCQLAARWAYEHDYKPVFWGDGFYGV